jgi:antitoxin ParD1/3/4
MERLTITLTPDLADRVKAAVQTGNYGSVSEVMRQALRDWELAEARRAQELRSLRDDVALGLKQVKAGKARPFDPARIVKAGEQLMSKKR